MAPFPAHNVSIVPVVEKHEKKPLAPSAICGKNVCCGKESVGGEDLKVELFLVQTITIGHRISKAQKSFIGARQLAMEFTLVTAYTCCKP